MNRAGFVVCFLASLLASCGGGNAPTLSRPAAPATTAGSNTGTSTYAQTVTYDGGPLPGLVCQSPEYPVGIAHTWTGTIAQTFAMNQTFLGQSGLVAVTSAVTLQGCAGTSSGNTGEPLSETDYYAQTQANGTIAIALVGSVVQWTDIAAGAQTMQIHYASSGLIMEQTPFKAGHTWSSAAGRTVTCCSGSNGSERLNVNDNGSYNDNTFSSSVTFPYDSTTTIENADASGSRTEVAGPNASVQPYTISLSAPSNNTVVVSTTGSPPIDPVLPQPTACATPGGTPCPSVSPTPYAQYAWYPYVPSASHPLETITSTDKGLVSLPASCNVSSVFSKLAELIETVDATLDIWSGTTTSTTDAYIDARAGVLCANVTVQRTYYAFGPTSADTRPTGSATLTFTDALQTQTQVPPVFGVPAMARYLSLWR